MCNTVILSSLPSSPWTSDKTEKCHIHNLSDTRAIDGFVSKGDVLESRKFINKPVGWCEVNQLHIYLYLYCNNHTDIYINIAIGYVCTYFSFSFVALYNSCSYCTIDTFTFHLIISLLLYCKIIFLMLSTENWSGIMSLPIIIS